MPEQTCPICFSQARCERPASGADRVDVECPRCGSYFPTRDAEHLLRQEVDISRDNDEPRLGESGSRKRATASAWVRANQEVELDSRDVPRLAMLRTPSVLDRAERLLLALSRESAAIGQQHDLHDHRWWAESWCLDFRETWELAKQMASRGWVEFGSLTHDSVPVHVAADGWQRLDELRSHEMESPQGFVAMWFADEMNRVYFDAIEPAIEAAGYRPHRVDQREFEGRIDDEIVAEIRMSRFLVADFTGHRGGVYFEVGLAQGLGLPVFFTCKKDELQHLHFDVRQYNTIDWDTPEELRDRLQKRIEAVLGRGPLSEGIGA